MMLRLLMVFILIVSVGSQVGNRNNMNGLQIDPALSAVDAETSQVFDGLFGDFSIDSALDPALLALVRIDTVYARPEIKFIGVDRAIITDTKGNTNAPNGQPSGQGTGTDQAAEANFMVKGARASSWTSQEATLTEILVIVSCVGGLVVAASVAISVLVLNKWRRKKGYTRVEAFSESLEAAENEEEWTPLINSAK